jgi:hypothetical protein
VFLKMAALKACPDFVVAGTIQTRMKRPSIAGRLRGG